MTWRAAVRPGKGLLRSLVTSYVALGITLYILPGRQSSGPLAVAGLVVVAAAVGVVLRPLLIALAVVLGPAGLLLVGVLSQAVVLDVALVVAPNVAVGSQPEVLLVSSVAATVAALANWLFDSGNDEVFLAQLLVRARRVARRERGLDGPTRQDFRGLLVVQFDGVGEPVLRQAITAGDTPTLAEWVRRGSHTVRRWHTGLPATTPAAQAVLLHGDVGEVPSFRWLEKETGTLMVANHPRDAACIERRISDGWGLLAGGGVSVSTLFSGDAPAPLLTMSDARLPARNTHGVASFVATGGGLARVLVVSIGQMVAELYQGRRQRRRHVSPRVRRGPTAALERAVTSALLRDLNAAIVAEQIARRTPVVFVDFVDYDEIAHHAGPTRPESMQTLAALDRLVRFFTDVIRETGNRFEVVILSDHGQTQGATFAQRSGQTLHEVVRGLTDEAAGTAAPDDVAEPVERWGSARLMLTGLARSRGRTARAERAPRDAPGDGRATHAVATGEARRRDAVVAVAAGSLAHLYLTDLPGRCTREPVERRHPRLIDGLAHHPHVGVVVVQSAAIGGPVAVGAHGWRVLTATGATGGTGCDPVAVFGPHSAEDLWALTARRHVGDLIVLGRYDPGTDDVAAFEDLVGSHGGLGGDQTEAFLLHPGDWDVPAGARLDGLDVHELLRAHLPSADRVRR